jgi:hypothetical protein
LQLARGAITLASQYSHSEQPRVSDLLTSQWRISDDAMANAVGGEMVILHIGNGTYYGLDAIGTQLWEGLKAGKTPNDVCDDLIEQYEVERSVLEADIAQFLEDLRANQLVEAA